MKKIFFSLLFIALSQINLAQVNLTQGLMAYYPFNGNANDISGNNNNPVFNNATLTTDRFGNPNSAYHFDGIDSYMQIPNSPTLNTNNQITICAWVRVTGFYYGLCHNNRMVMKGDADYIPGNYTLAVDDNLYTHGNNCTELLPDTIHQNFRGIVSSSNAYGPYVNKDEWYSVVYTYDGTTSRFYQDCKLVDSIQSPATFTNTYDLFFGKLNNTTYPYWFNGDMDEVRIYNRAINQDEVNTYGGCPLSNPCSSHCQLVNNLVINTGYNPITKTTIPTGQQDSNWIVTAISSDMQNAFCSENTSGPLAPTGTTVSPVNIDQPAYVIQTFPAPWIQSDTYLSCFPYNTMYTVEPAATNTTNCIMEITRNFYICSSGNENITFNFSASIDDETGPAIIDAGTPNAITLSNGGSGLTPPLAINSTQNLTPGMHTLSIECINLEDVNGIYENLPSGVSAQWNPFGIAVTGTISSANNDLIGPVCCTPTYNTIDTTICSNQSYLGHTATGAYFDTLANAAGCDSIITINLTVCTNCIAPTNSLTITSGHNATTNTDIPAGQTDPNWIVTSLSPDMQNAFCNGNSTGSGGAPSNALSVPPVQIGQPAYVVPTQPTYWPAGTYISCFPYNTTYTVIPSQNNFTSCFMKLQRNFSLSGNNNQNVTFNFTITADDIVDSVILDAGTPNAIMLSKGQGGINTPLTVNATVNLKPGTHTISMQCINQELTSPPVIAYALPSGNQVEFNPFGVYIQGAITTTNNAIQTSTVSVITGDTNICTGNTTTLANTTPDGIWSSSNTSVATVTQNGVVTGIATGNTAINYIVGAGNCIDSTKVNFTVTNCCIRSFSTIDTTLCASQNYLGHNITGTYFDTLTNAIGCDSIITINLIIDSLSADFTFSQNICSPKTVSFIGTIDSPYTSYKWNFANSTTNNSTLTPTITYPGFGTYTVQLSIINSSGCTDTISKSIPITVIPSNIILTPDTTICFGSTKQLRTKPSLNFCWSPTIYLDDPTLPNPTTSAPATTTYYFTAEVQGNNLIKNGDFSQGNIGFTSQYLYETSNETVGNGAGQYFIGTNPNAWNPGMSASCTDHTGASGNGNEMIVNGAAIPDVVVWSETIPITPNTNYAFSTWAQNLAPSNYINSSLQFSINSNLIGNVFNTNLNQCIWNQFYSTWNSGNATSAVISIVNNTLIASGNDFALDDISFTPINIEQDSVIISVDTAAIQTSNDTAVCANSPVQLNTTGANTYSWSPVKGLSNAAIANPVATLNSLTKYYVTGITVDGCTAKDSVTIKVDPNPVVIKSDDTSICRNTSVLLSVSGGISYQWQPTPTLNNLTTATPVATPAGYEIYHVTVTGSNTCATTDSIRVGIRPLPVFTVSPDQFVCTTTPIQLSASGGDTYLWSPASLVSNPAIANPMTNTSATTTYSVLITESTCNNDSTLTTTLTLNPPLKLIATKSNDLDCSNGSARLLVSGATFYNWSPGNSLNDSSIANPIAAPLTTQQYIVKGSNLDGCSGYDTIIVYANYVDKSAGYYMPNAFTPNGDGLNDCYGIKYWGLIEKIDFTIYDRWGNKIFYSNDPNACWDGTYKGQPADAAGYVYYISAITACGHVERKGTFVLIR